MSRASWVLVALLATYLVGCDDPVPTYVTQPDPLDPSVPPRVVSTYPPDSGVGPFELYLPQGSGRGRPHFVIQFDKLIDLNRFESRWLRMEGFEAPLEFMSTRYSNQLTDLLSIVVFDSATRVPNAYQIGRTYTVTVDTTLRDATGNHPAAPHRFSFVPEPFFRIVDVVFDRGQPVWGNDRVGLTWNAVPASGSSASIRFDPPVLGSWSGFDESLIFTHEQPFTFGTTYILHVDATVMDVEGNSMTAPFATTFQVRSFEIMATNPRDGDTWVWPSDRRIFFAVSGPVDTTSVLGAFAVEPALSGWFSWGTTSFAFWSNVDLQPSTPYRVELSTALRGWDGTALAAPYVLTFITDSFGAYDSQPYPGAVDVALGITISIQFNMELDPSTLEDAFAIAPPVSGTLSLRNPLVLEFRPDALLAPATHYEVTISTALRAANGAAFPAPYTLSFTTHAHSSQANM